MIDAVPHPRTGKPVYPGITPLDATSLAHLLHKSLYFMNAVAKEADTPFSGKWATIAEVSSWLKQHPEFRAKAYHDRRRAELAAEREFAAKLAKARESGNRAA